MYRRSLSSVLFTVVLALFAATAQAGEDSVCAEVKIEIAQELTVERQAFEATMRITNSLDGFTLEDMQVTLALEDANGDPVIATSDPNHATATFFVRLDDTRGVSNIATGEGGAITNGQIGPAETGELRWLIIPTPGAGGDTEDGKLYFVGAKLELRYGNERETLIATPDSIRVKPQPTLVLDYFLPGEVHGNNPMTPEIEPVEPYTLGVRVANTGSGAAHNLRIESAQPEIVENDQGLLVDFNITGSYIDDDRAQRTLLLNFGSIPSGHNRMGRWIMESSLSGRFIAFNARMTHAEELGGALTSLIEDVYTHTLVADVLVDLPDRDRIRDYLARAGTELRVFESERTGMDMMDCVDCAPVADLSGSLGSGQTTPNGLRHTLTVPSSDDFVHVKVADPYQGERPLTRATRANGSLLHGANMWQSKSRQDDGITYDYYVHIFDARPATEYHLVFGTEPVENRPPQIAFIPDYSIKETEQVGFLVMASDPDGTIPSLTVEQLPSGATFNDRGNGQGVFHWVPDVGQAGEYELTFKASDGALTATRSTRVTVKPLNDAEGGDEGDDGSGDGSPGDGDGSGDDTGEGEGGDSSGPITNAPAAVQIISPIHDARVGLEPILELRSTQYDAAKAVTYTLEFYTDAAMTDRFVRLEDIHQAGEYTAIALSGHVADSLTPGKTYFWRVKADTPVAGTEWVYSRFTVVDPEAGNHLISLHSPRDGVSVDSLRPTLAVNNAAYGPDAAVTYDFQVYAEHDQDFSDPVASIAGIPAGSTGVTRWTVSADLTEGERYLWLAIADDGFGNVSLGEAGSFTVDLANQAPSKPALVSPAAGAVLTSTTQALVAQGATDPEGAAVSYHFELLNAQGGLLQEATLDPENGQATWALQGLDDNARYRWRVRASDGQADSAVAEGYFDVVTGNQPPLEPTRGNPAHKAWIQVLEPTLWVRGVNYPAGVAVEYEFELYRDAQGTDLVDASTRNEAFWPLSFALANHRDYYWRVRALAANGSNSPWSELHRFYVNEGGGNVPPTLDFVLPERDITLEGGEVLIQWLSHDPDSDATITLFYNEDQVIAEGIPETLDGSAGQYRWNLDALAPGEYRISALIEDEEHQVQVENCCVVRKLASDARVVVTPVTERVTDERGLQLAEVDLSLEGPPASGTAVVVGLSLSDNSVAEILDDREYVEFNSDNWSQPQRVRVRGKDDCRADGDRNYFLRFANSVSADPQFNNLATPSVSLTNRDKAEAGQQHFICDYETLRKETVESGVIEHELRPRLVNRGEGISSAEASLQVPQSGVSLVDGSTVSFGGVANGNSVLGEQTFTLRYPEDQPALTRALTWSIVTHQPEIESEPAPIAEAGVGYAYQIQVSGDGEADYSFRVLEGPDGLTVDPVTGLVTWEPGAGQTGMHSVVVEVVDQHGGVSRQRFTLEVVPEGMGGAQVVIVDTDPNASNAHFTSLQDAVAAMSGVLESPVVIYARASSGLPDTVPVRIRDIETTPENNITINFEDGYLLDIMPQLDGVTAIQLRVRDVRLRGNGGVIRVHRNGRRNIGGISTNVSNAFHVYDGLIVEGDAGDGSHAFSGIVTAHSDSVSVVRNSVIRGFNGGSGNTGLHINNEAYVYNNALIGNGLGLRVTGSDSVVFNNISQDNVSADYGFWFGAWHQHGHNLSSDNSSPDAAFRGLNVHFNDAENGDFRLSPWDDAVIGQGLNLSHAGAHSFAHYADGSSRTGSWHLGPLPVASLTHQPPVITSEPVRAVEQGRDYRYAIEASADGSEPLTFTLAGSPSGMSVNPETGVISWFPTTLQVGEHNVAIEVTDARGGMARQDYRLIVSPGEAAGARLVVVDTNPEAEADFTSFAGAIAAQEGVLDEPLLIRLRASSGLPDTQAVVIDGIETTSEAGIQVVLESGYRLEYTAPTFYARAITVRANHVRLVGEGGVIQFRNNGHGYSTAIHADPRGANNLHIFDSLRVEGIMAGDAFNVKGIDARADHGHYVFRNNLIHGFAGGMTNAGIANHGVARAYNNTLVGNGVGIQQGGANAHAFNNLSVNNDHSDYYVVGGRNWVDHSHNLSSDDTSPDASLRQLSVLFQGSSLGDYRLAPDDEVAIGAGRDLSSLADFPFNTDASGAVRVGDWNLGALPVAR